MRSGDSIRFEAEPYRVAAAETVAAELGLSLPVATTLARRGFDVPADAREFLAAEETHDPDLFEGIETVAGTILDAVRDGEQVTIYGDFDADGVCSTAVLVGVIRALGGNCDWYIPDRIDGYGLNQDAVRALASRGTELIVTVDCGVTSVTEVALAKELGMGILVTDHHQTGPELPDCPILHPEVSSYPFPALCGTAVAAKLAVRLRRDGGLDPAGNESDLDLVALATVADVMPLIGENRQLVKAGMKVARRARRVGVAALLEEVRVVPARLSSEDLGFRLAPRINAAGRMYRADAGVELFLAESPERAREIARELSAANAERRRVERDVVASAGRVLAGMEKPGAAIVVAGDGWHPGVVGIVASRLVKKHGRPAVVISLDGELGKGSARGVPGLDLYAAIGEAAGYLEGFGGHAAAAGLQIRTDRVDGFRMALEASVEARIGTDPVPPSLRFDAVAGGEDLGLPLAEDLEKLEPFGKENPPVSLLIPGARITDLREMGEGKHCRFTIVSGSHRAAGICFGRNSLGTEEDDRVDLLAELGINHWNGSIEPRVQVREVLPVPAGEPLVACGPAEWWSRFETELARFAESSDPRPEAFSAPTSSRSDGSMSRRENTVQGLPGLRIAELISSGEPVAILTADAPRRWRSLGGAAGLGRFLPEIITGQVLGLWAGSPDDLVHPGSRGVRSGSLPEPGYSVLLLDYAALARRDPAVLTGFPHVVVLDPAPSAAERSVITAGEGCTHFVGGEDEREFALEAAAHHLDPTVQLREIYAAVRAVGAIDDAPGLAGEPLREILAGPTGTDRSPERAAALVQILMETKLLRTGGAGSGRMLGVVSSVKTELAESPLFVAHLERYKEQVRFLKQSNRPTN